MDQPKSTNPLANFFRQPVIHLRLPSNGQFWPDGSLNMPLNNELPIFSMTTKDEITLRTPDALLNGSGIVDVIQSCCPSIVNAWHAPSVDMDALLIAIRIATYGQEMNVDTKCPHCGEENHHGLDLRTILDTIICPDYSNKLEFNGVKIKLRPQAFFTANKAKIIQFEEQKIIQAINNSTLDDDVKVQQVGVSMNKISNVSLDILTDNTEYVEISNGSVVTNRDHIREYYGNVENKLTNMIRTELVRLNESTQISNQRIKCSSCEKEYEVPLDFDYSNFFGNGF